MTLLCCVHVYQCCRITYVVSYCYSFIYIRYSSPNNLIASLVPRPNIPAAAGDETGVRGRDVSGGRVKRCK